MHTIGGLKMQYYIHSCLKLQARLEGLGNQPPCEFPFQNNERLTITIRE